jgi:hypothetical protein
LNCGEFTRNAHLPDEPRVNLRDDGPVTIDLAVHQTDQPVTPRCQSLVVSNHHKRSAMRLVNGSEQGKHLVG